MNHSGTFIQLLIAYLNNKWTGKFLIIALCISFSLVYAQTGGLNSGAMVKLIAPNGMVTPLQPAADDDGDGIDNALEIQGFTYSITDGLQPWDGDQAKKYYITDPLKWSTDGDPYSDYTEVTGVKMHPAVTWPENHPLVASSPIIVVKMPEYSITPNGEITEQGV